MAKKRFKRLTAGLFNRGMKRFAEKLAKSHRERLEKVLANNGAAAALMANVNEKLKGDGTFIDSIEQLLQWLIDHQEQILALVKAVMLLFGL